MFFQTLPMFKVWLSVYFQYFKNPDFQRIYVLLNRMTCASDKFVSDEAY